MQQSFSLDTDHFQFYLEDLSIDHDTSTLWDAAAMQSRLDALDGLLAIGTARWGTHTTVTVMSGVQAPEQEDVSRWDHIVTVLQRTPAALSRCVSDAPVDLRAAECNRWATYSISVAAPEAHGQRAAGIGQRQ